MAFMAILYDGNRTTIKAFFYSYIFKCRKYMKYKQLNSISSTLLTIKPEPESRLRGICFLLSCRVLAGESAIVLLILADSSLHFIPFRMTRLLSRLLINVRIHPFPPPSRGLKAVKSRLSEGNEMLAYTLPSVAIWAKPKGI